MPEVDPFLFAEAGSFTSPHAYTVPGAGEVQPYTATATYVNNSGQAILPALRLKSSSGNLLALVFPSTTIANGGSSEVSFVPPFGSAATSSAGGTGIQFDTEPQSGSWLDVETTGADANGNAVTFTDNSGNGWTFLNNGFGNHGAGLYVQSDDASASGFPTAFQVQANETNAATAVGVSVNADASSGTGVAQGALITADAKAAAGATGLLTQGSILSGAGSASADGINATGDSRSANNSGDTHGGVFLGQNSGSGKSIGILATGNNPTGGTGDTIGAVIVAEKQAGGAGTLYGLQVFIGTTKVFQVNADGSLHGLTGKSLTFDL